MKIDGYKETLKKQWEEVGNGVVVINDKYTLDRRPIEVSKYRVEVFLSQGIKNIKPLHVGEALVAISKIDCEGKKLIFVYNNDEVEDIESIRIDNKGGLQNG